MKKNMTIVSRNLISKLPNWNSNVPNARDDMLVAQSSDRDYVNAHTLTEPSLYHNPLFSELENWSEQIILRRSSKTNWVRQKETLDYMDRTVLR